MPHHHQQQQQNFIKVKLPHDANEDPYLADFPPGPLDVYRKTASFNWREMKTVIEDEAVTQFKHQIWRTLENDPLFAQLPTELSLEDKRRLTMAQLFRVLDYNFLPPEKVMEDPRLNMAFILALGQYDWSLSLKKALLTGFFNTAIIGLGTKKHYHFVDKMDKSQLLGCFCLTEISHGTDTKSMRTMATFDRVGQQWILHTPDFEAAKCWAGNLAKTATHAIVFAQLHTDGQCHGLHAFVVPIRDTNTLIPFPGITIGDMGAKLGLNGLDNGYMTFDHYAIPRDALLNKTGDVTPEGKYVTPFKDPNKRFGASLGNLSAGRVGIVCQSVVNLCHVVPIAIRYSSVRRQFGVDGVEFPVIEYQMQQWRLFPYLAATYVLKIFGDQLSQNYTEFLMMGLTRQLDPTKLSDMGAEIHAISCSAKPLASWTARDAAQECREACGGHGYLRSSGIGKVRDDNEPNCSYEGDNNVLLQQTSNWLLSLWGAGNSKMEQSPLGSTSFLAKRDTFHHMKFTPKTTLNQIMNNVDIILVAYDWLVCWLLEATAGKLNFEIQSLNKDTFTSRNDTQIYHARTTALAYIERLVVLRFRNFISEKSAQKTSPEICSILHKLMILYGLWSLEKHMASLYQGGYAEGPEMASLIREGILKLCVDLKEDAVALVDVVAPPDFILNSTLGHSNGQVYKNLQAAMQQTPNGLERPDWWKDVTLRLQAKL